MKKLDTLHLDLKEVLDFIYRYSTAFGVGTGILIGTFASVLMLCGQYVGGLLVGMVGGALLVQSVCLDKAREKTMDAYQTLSDAVKTAEQELRLSKELSEKLAKEVSEKLDKRAK